MTKNPKRVAAGRANRALRSPLSEHSRQKLRDAAIVHKPWRHTTGPRTDTGKKRVAGNARKPASSGDETPAVDPTLVNAAALLKRVAALRKGCYVDVESIQIVQCDSVADQLRDIIVEASQSITRDLSASLMASCCGTGSR